MIKNSKLRILVLFVAIVLLPAMHCLSKHSNSEKPNVVIIYTDDHRFSGVHALAGTQVKTPNMDKLAESGATFLNTYLNGAFSGATCVASRAQLLTGRDVFSLNGIGKLITPDQKTIGETFQDAGYHTHIIGKWHQDKETIKRSFSGGNCVKGLNGGLNDHYRMVLNEWDPSLDFPKDSAYVMQYNSEGKTVKIFTKDAGRKKGYSEEKDGPHTSEIWADAAINFFEGYKKDNPFMLYLAFHAPHDPRQAPKEYYEMYPPEDIELLPSYMPVHPFDNGELWVRDEKLCSWPRTPELAKQHLADYYAIITHLDAQIGRVIASLEKQGLNDNTIIVLVGDSGLAVGNHGLMGKQSLYDEDGIHVPLIISGKGIKHARHEALSYIHDVFPTLCELTGTAIPESVKGKSLVPVIQNKEKEVRPYLYHAYKHVQRAYRKGDFKLIEYVQTKDAKNNRRGSRVTQLFNVKNDPWETLNLAISPEYVDKVKEMQAEFLKAAKAENDNLNSSATKGYKFGFWDFY